MNELCPGCGSKMKSHWPDIEKLTIPTLRHLLITIDDIKDRMTMQYKNEIELAHPLGLENLSYNDHKKCIHFLQELNLISGFRYGLITVHDSEELGEIYEQIKKEIVKREIKEKPIPNFDSENSILYIGSKQVKITKKNDKPNDHYILEYIFENNEGLKAKSYYTEIMEKKFDRERVNQKSLYRSCQNINLKVSEQAGIGKFLIIKSTKNGYTQINTDYL